LSRWKWCAKTHLIETSCADSIVDITGLPEDVRILTIARFPQTERFFAGNSLGCRGDFTIFDVANKRIIHLEIKRTNKSVTDIRNQLIGSSALVEYFRSLACRKMSERHYLEDYDERFVSIGYTAIEKRDLSGRKISGSGKSANDIRRVYYPGILPYKKLID
jgi:hypothetical protein